MNSKSLNPKVLLLTYAFPPLQASESFLSVKAFAKIKSFDIDVLTINSKKIGYAMDYSLDNYVKTNFSKIYRSNPPNWINKMVFRILRYVPGFPDRFRFFNRQLFKKALEIDITGYDLIVTWSTWHSIHMVGAKIKNKFPSIKWLAHFSDPWADNPFITRFFASSPYNLSQYFLEKSVINNADAINFTTHRSRMLVMKKYPPFWINKTYVTPHSYDKSLYQTKKEKVVNDKFIVNYLEHNIINK